jgi:hypothetical protein
MNRRLTGRATAGDLILMKTSRKPQSQHFLDLAHRQPFLGHSLFLHPPVETMGMPTCCPALSFLHENVSIPAMRIFISDPREISIHFIPESVIHMRGIHIHIKSERLFTSPGIRTLPRLMPAERNGLHFGQDSGEMVHYPCFSILPRRLRTAAWESRRNDAGGAVPISLD